jgi:copper resistance protein B
MPTPNRDWLAIGFQGLAPYFFEIDAAAFIGNNGQTALRLEAEYEVMLTQKLILTPEVEINAYSKDDEATGVGSGLSDIELGLRLRYEIRREFAPYIGVNWNKKYGDTANFSRDEGEDVSDTQFVVGIRAWF